MVVRIPAYRYSPIVTVLVAVNLTVLFSLFYSFNVQDYSWRSNQLPERSESGVPSREVPQPTFTVTAVTTETAIVETVRPPSPPKIPGPPFCDVCGSDDPLCTLYGCARSQTFMCDLVDRHIPPMNTTLLALAFMKVQMPAFVALLPTL
jgi:hypothetical protein